MSIPSAEKTDGAYRICAVKGFEENNRRAETAVFEREIAIAKEDTLELLAEFAQGKIRYSCRINNMALTEIADAFETSAGRWIGAKTGIFCLNRFGASGSGYTDFESVEIR